MGHADALSRCPLPVTDTDPAPSSMVLSIDSLDLPLSSSDVAAHSLADTTLS